MILLARKVAAGEATIDFTEFDADLYGSYQIFLANVIPATDNKALRWRTSSDGGIGYDSGAAAYKRSWIGMDGTPGSGEDTPTQVAITSGMGNAGAESGASGIITIYQPHLLKFTNVVSQIMYFNEAERPAVRQVHAYRQEAAVVNGFQFHMTAGNIQEGLFSLYGIPKGVPVVQTDADFANVSLLLNPAAWDADASDNAHVVTAVNGVDLTADPVLFNGVDHHLTIPNHASLVFAGTYTIELFGVKFLTRVGTRFMGGIWLETGNKRSWELYCTHGSQVVRRQSQSGAGSITYIGSTWAPTDDTAVDICYVKQGTAVKVFIDGVQTYTHSYRAPEYASSAEFVWGGGKPAGSLLDPQHMSCRAIRITKGVTRYWANYTVPSLPLPETGP